MKNGCESDDSSLLRRIMVQRKDFHCFSDNEYVSQLEDMGGCENDG